jgi:hypothetical protein
VKRTIGVAVAVALSMGMLTGASASTPKLSSELLSIGQMPTGWSVDNSSSGSGIGCLTYNLEPKGIRQTSHASVFFAGSGNIPVIEETLATFTNATTAYKKIVATLNGCKHISGTKGGVKATGTVGQMSFPHYGNASAAFSVSLVTQGTTIGEDVLIVRKGNVVMEIVEADLPPVDVSQFQGFVVKALAKLPASGAGKPVTTKTSVTNGSSPSSPIPFGQTASVEGWNVKVISVAPEATDPALLKPPPAGYLFEVVTLKTTRTGSTAESPIELSAALLGPSKAQRSVDTNPMCFGGTPYNDLVEKGGTVDDGYCISIPKNDTKGLVLGLGTLSQLWFATGPNVG